MILNVLVGNVWEEIDNYFLIKIVILVVFLLRFKEGKKIIVKEV